MIIVLRRWQVPAERREWFLHVSHDRLAPAFMKHPGIIRAELYEAGTGDYFVSAFWWQDEESRRAATSAMIADFSQVYAEMIPYERNAPEILILSEPGGNTASRRFDRSSDATGSFAGDEPPSRRD